MKLMLLIALAIPASVLAMSNTQILDSFTGRESRNPAHYPEVHHKLQDNLTAHYCSERGVTDFKDANGVTIYSIQGNATN